MQMTTPKEQKLEVSRLHPGKAGEIAAFLAATDTDFSPPLNQRTDLKSYAEKLASKAELVGARRNGELMGLAAFYCNDKASKRAYVTYVGVKREARGLGLGTDVMREVIRISAESGMETMTLQIDGDRDGVLEFYTRLGFEVAETYTRFGGFAALRLCRRLRQDAAASKPACNP